MSISTADAASTPLFYNIHSRPTRLLSAVSMTLKQASRLTLNNKNDVVCWDAACNKKNSNMERLFRQKWFWQGAVTCVKTLPWYLHSDIGTTSDPNVETFETFWMVWNHAKKQKKKDPSIFQWHFVAAIQTCVVYSFTPPIFTHETSV